jgi:hypothetical protein
MANLATVTFPQVIDLNNWCLGTQPLSKSGDNSEHWDSSKTLRLIWIARQRGARAMTACRDFVVEILFFELAYQSDQWI